MRRAARTRACGARRPRAVSVCASAPVNHALARAVHRVDPARSLGGRPAATAASPPPRHSAMEFVARAVGGAAAAGAAGDEPAVGGGPGLFTRTSRHPCSAAAGGSWRPLRSAVDQPVHDRLDTSAPARRSALSSRCAAAVVRVNSLVSVVPPGRLGTLSRPSGTPAPWLFPAAGPSSCGWRVIRRPYATWHCPSTRNLLVTPLTSICIPRPEASTRDRRAAGRCDNWIPINSVPLLSGRQSGCYRVLVVTMTVCLTIESCRAARLPHSY